MTKDFVIFFPFTGEKKNNITVKKYLYLGVTHHENSFQFGILPEINMYRIVLFFCMHFVLCKNDNFLIIFVEISSLHNYTLLSMNLW